MRLKGSVDCNNEELKISMKFDINVEELLKIFRIFCKN